jgi:hypothetical protein
MGTYGGDPFFEWFPTHAGYWKNGTWFVLDTGDSMVSSLVVLGSDWYAGGYITSSVGSSSRREVGYWKNGSWIALASPYTNTNPIADTTVCALVVQGNVYACGYCISSYEWFPCYWRNGTWIALTKLLWLGIWWCSLFTGRHTPRRVRRRRVHQQFGCSRSRLLEEWRLDSAYEPLWLDIWWHCVLAGGLRHGRLRRRHVLYQ